APAKSPDSVGRTTRTRSRRATIERTPGTVGSTSRAAEGRAHHASGGAAHTLVPMHFETLAIHAGQEPDAGTGAVVPPIFQTSTYKQDGVGGLRGGYEYSRSANPTRTALEECLAAIEDGRRGLAFASGLAAEHTVLRALCVPGDHAVIPGDAYGGTYRLFNRVEAPWGLDFTPAAGHDVDAFAAAIRPGVTKIVWVETPTNPLMGIVDIAAVAQLAHEAGAL